MGFFTIVIMALALATDAFAVSVVNSICYVNQSKKSILFACLMFGLFQTFMPLIGFFAGSAFVDIISDFDQWIAFILLSAIGGKMTVECIKDWKKDASCPTNKSPSVKVIICQAFATSIDALVVGVSLVALEASIVFPSILIGLITFTTCLIGHLLGKKLGSLFSKWAHLVGAIVLIGIGISILLRN